jgi:hypothetical protein
MAESTAQAVGATELQTHPLGRTESFVQDVTDAQATVPQVMTDLVAAMLPPSTSEAVRRTRPAKA